MLMNKEGKPVARKAGGMKLNIKTAAFVLAACILAILSKLLLPSEVNEADFNSVFIKSLGFPVVASLYFVLIYSHNAIATRILAKRTSMANSQVGLRLGLCFGLIYLFGMQEVVVEASPFSEWGIQFVFYQFVMGIGEAIVALLLCLSVARYASSKKSSETKSPVVHNKALLMLLIMTAFTFERSICCETGIISSNVATFTVPHYAWTVIFGFVLGACFVIICPLFLNGEPSLKLCVKASVLTIGLGWMLFNLFIGLLFDGALSDVLLRSGIDVAALFVASVLWLKICETKRSRV